MTRAVRQYRGSIAALWLALSLSAAAAQPKYTAVKDPLEPARAALRTLQFNRAIDLLQSAAHGGNPEAQYLLGLDVPQRRRHGR
jgi:TPR repeat protein